MIENKYLTEEEIFEENINKITKEFEKNNIKLLIYQKIYINLQSEQINSL